MATGATRELPEAEAPALMEEACDILVPAGMHVRLIHAYTAVFTPAYRDTCMRARSSGVNVMQ